MVNKFAVDSSFLRVKKTGLELYSLCFQSVGAFLFLFITGSLLFSSIFVFAQIPNGAAGNIQKMTTANGSNPSAAAANNNSALQPPSSGSQGPVTTKISDKGIYKVQLTFVSPSPIQSPSILPKKGFQMEIDFLNASAPPPAAQTIPQKESVESFVAGLHGTQPGIIQRLVPIDSFDMTIYSSNGKVLWNKTNQAVTSGRAIETISFTNSSYAGDITILIDNIKASNTMAGGNPMTPLSTPAPKGTPDSVKFTATLA